MLGEKVDKLIEEARQRVVDEKDDRARALAERRSMVMTRIRDAVARHQYLSGVDGDELVRREDVVYDLAAMAQRVRISQAEALADMADMGVFDEAPYWYEVRPVWKGYVRPNRYARVRVCATHDGRDVIPDNQPSGITGYPARMDISIRQTCKGYYIGMAYLEGDRGPASFGKAGDEEGPVSALVRAYCSAMAKRGVQVGEGEVSPKLREILDRALKRV